MGPGCVKRRRRSIAIEQVIRSSPLWASTPFSHSLGKLLTHATQQKGDCRMRANTLCHARLALSPALTAVARCFVLSLDSEQIVTKKAVRLHCHSVPRSGSDTACGRPTATAAPTATIATAAIASVLDLCQMNLMAFSDLRGLKSALCRHDSLRASSPLRNRTTGTSLPRTSAPLAPVTMSDSALAGFSRRRLQHDRRIEDHQVAAASPQR